MQGCRAILLDKDRNPKVVQSTIFILACVSLSIQHSSNAVAPFCFAFLQWEPSKLELVSDAMVDKYFSKIDEEDWEDLKLPARPSTLPPSAISKL